MQHATAIIPARLASTRFPRKVLADVAGRPLILHVCERARRASLVSRVVVATDSQEVASVVRAAGVEAVLTREDHPNGTSRLAEAAALLRLPADHVIANVQGDEPEIDPDVIDAAIEVLLRSNAHVGTVASPFLDGELPDDPNLVKVICRPDGTALYFSRSRIPFQREGAAAAVPPLRHVGLYTYRTGFLAQYAAMPSTPLEQTEMLEQLRVLESGYQIAVAVRTVRSTGIDTLAQYDALIRRTASVRSTFDT